MNQFIKYYDTYKISPVSQDISDLSLHIKRRQRLYRLLGIDYRLFKGAEILEVGAGSGYNTLVFLLLGAKVDIVEPNPTGREEMRKLFEKHHISSSQYTIYDCVIEEFNCSTQYDLVIAEGFLPTLDTRSMQESVVRSLVRSVKKEGFVVCTSMCEFSYFFEDMRRMLGHLLISNSNSYEENVEILSKAFRVHLENLKFSSRPIEDWVKDTILNPSLDSAFLDMAKCIKLFCEVDSNMEVLETSPSIIKNLSWYKDTEYSYANTIVEEFRGKQHLLLSVSLNDNCIRDTHKNEILLNDLMQHRRFIKELKESGPKKELMNNIILNLQEIVWRNMDLVGGGGIIESIKESIALIQQDKITSDDVANMAEFAKAWGRGQQYISFIKG